MKKENKITQIDKNTNVTNKIVVGLQRISEAFKVLLWEKAKEFGLSPIQIQILIFIQNHKATYCNVSYLAKEFNVTKPTISDAIKALEKKEMIVKDYSSSDSRSYTIFLSELGKNTVLKNDDYGNPIYSEIEKIPQKEQEKLFSTLSSLIYQLNQKNILTVQRTCFACKFYSKNNKKHHCNLLEKELLNSEIRLDCDEFENAS
ncbi:MarR family transcriptional regulator [Tenacibaculum todarodis]|uniref:MarR family transcriptional regulator n=1 Tax=Tenacibaculum todarodis TaxID=1850252 RepID=A0A1L3JLI1_9FLAO|nr:MarR family winged helix-turn-helix transcriptional regulator [Tenacibaculum todarodis]APG65987.1 MarR family transcriptional regulator [Tenacibaculum todarodis]